MTERKKMNKPNIVEVTESEGIQLKQRGNQFWARCPLHEDNTPSFKIDSQIQLFYCFGCGEGGDVIRLIEKLKGCSFKDALVYLEISNGNPPKAYKVQVTKRNLLKDFKQWCHEYYCELCEELLALDEAKKNAKSFGYISFLAEFYHGESVWKYHADILFNGSDEQKYQLYLEVEDGNRST
tara:strand:- start:467 stop:1009 length:543 start_codon:yes stop_codon:yes gene_type:complete